MTNPSWQLMELQNAPIQIIDGDRGVNYPKAEDFSSSGYCLFLNTGNIKDDVFDLGTGAFISETKDALLRKGKLKRGDIVLTTRGTVGSVAFYHSGIGYDHVRINSGMVILRGNGSIANEYLYHLLKSPFVKQQYLLFSSGSAQPQLPIKDLKRIKVTVPPVTEQKKIASILSAYDDLIENNKRRIAILEKMAEEIYRESFVRMRFSVGTSSQQKKLLPKVPLRKCIDMYIGGGWGSDEPTAEDRNPVYVLRGTDFEDLRFGITKDVPLRFVSDNALRTRTLKHGDIVMENSVNHNSRTAGKSILMTDRLLSLFDKPVICASFCKLIRPKDFRYSKFLEVDFKVLFKNGLFDYFQNIATNGIANLQAERLMDKHLVPSLEDTSTEALTEIDSTVFSAQIALLTKARDLLLPRLISGKLSVEDLDLPSTESASSISSALPHAELAHA